ncbi:hypothetical protein I4U23_020052 [Adineta vaga]|nr:hypothetical protein I4U23_020052 [Adineta vaga]
MAKESRPQWVITSHIKDVDLHGYQSMDLALDKVKQTLAIAKKHEQNSYKIIPGRGTHSEVNQYGRKYKETKNWKREINSVLFEAVREYLKTVQNEFHVYEMPTNNNATEIYIRAKSAMKSKSKRSSLYLPEDLIPPNVESDLSD